MPQLWHTACRGMSSSFSMGTLNVVAISLSASTPGCVSPHSQRDTAWRVTNRRSAISAWVRPFRSLISMSVSLIAMKGSFSRCRYSGSMEPWRTRPRQATAGCPTGPRVRRGRYRRATYTSMSAQDMSSPGRYASKSTVYARFAVSSSSAQISSQALATLATQSPPRMAIFA